MASLTCLHVDARDKGGLLSKSGLRWRIALRLCPEAMPAFPKILKLLEGICMLVCWSGSTPQVALYWMSEDVGSIRYLYLPLVWVLIMLQCMLKPISGIVHPRYSNSRFRMQIQMYSPSCANNFIAQQFQQWQTIPIVWSAFQQFHDYLRRTRSSFYGTWCKASRYPACALFLVSRKQVQSSYCSESSSISVDIEAKA